MSQVASTGDLVGVNGLFTHGRPRRFTMQQRIGNVRWGIAGLLGTGIVINYLDRVNISVATPPFEHEFHLPAGEMGIILSSSLSSYVLLQLPVAALLDRFDVKCLVAIGAIFSGAPAYMTA